MAREVGLPLMRGLVALAHGDADGAADLIYPVRAVADRTSRKLAGALKGGGKGAGIVELKARRRI